LVRKPIARSTGLRVFAAAIVQTRERTAPAADWKNRTAACDCSLLDSTGLTRSMTALKFHQTVGVCAARSPSHTHNGKSFSLGIDGEMDHAEPALVGADVANDLPPAKGVVFLELQTDLDCRTWVVFLSLAGCVKKFCLCVSRQLRRIGSRKYILEWTQRPMPCWV
jgi:hypothetical protein